MGTHPIFESDFDCLTESESFRYSLGHSNMIDSMTSEDYPSSDISELKRIEEKQRNIELEIEKEKEKLLKSLKNKYAEELTNLSNKREEVIGRIQCFWAEALANHEIIGDLVSDEDIEIFEYMKTMTVIEPSADDPRQATTIVFVFKDNNPYFHNTRLEKVFFTNPKGEQSIEFKPIRWKVRPTLIFLIVFLIVFF